jgi:hypothetical protein
MPADYIIKLPKAERDLDDWQAAVEALLLVVELDGPTMMARIGVMRQSTAAAFGSLIQRARTCIGESEN